MLTCNRLKSSPSEPRQTSLSAELKMSANQLNMKLWMKIILVKRKHIETTQLISSSGSIDHPLTSSGEHIGRFKLSTAKVTVKWRQKSVFWQFNSQEPELKDFTPVIAASTAAKIRDQIGVSFNESYNRIRTYTNESIHGVGKNTIYYIFICILVCTNGAHLILLV